MDTTVDDFWRMIVEQGCGVVVMLTNLEETGKVKCVKYWPEADQPKTFGNITIYLVKEKAYSGESGVEVAVRLSLPQREVIEGTIN